MAVQYSYPGVYIEELPAVGPIEGVGTSTAAFAGPARAGVPNRPTLVTSFDEFQQEFDHRPLNGFYLWYAVRGFFENGGRRAHIVRVSNGSYATADLDDSRTNNPEPVLSVRARGLGSLAIPVAVQHVSYVSTSVYQAQAKFTPTPTSPAVLTLTSLDPAKLTDIHAAAQFRAGDKVLLEGAGNPEIAVVRRVSGTTLFLTSQPANNYSQSGTVRLADLAFGDTVMRVNSTLDQHVLGVGSVIDIVQAGPNPHNQAGLVVASVQPERLWPGVTTYRVELESGLTSGPYDLAPGASEISIDSQEFSLTINGGETREYLSMARNNPRYFATILAAEPFNTVVVQEAVPPSTAPLHLLRPAVTSVTLGGGANEDLQALDAQDYQAALDALRTLDDVNFVAVPDSTRLPVNDQDTVQLALLTHCTQLADRFAIFDPPVTDSRDTVGSTVDKLRSERGFGALYYPWIWVPHYANGLLLVPPSGHMAGIYARSDAEQGVHKAPANYILNGALGVAEDMNDEYQGVLNLDGINVLRVFPNSSRPVVWGARTTSTDTAWQYVNIRRLFLYLEESIEEGLRWAVFEPNNLQLWQKLKRTITEFLTRVWRDGALFGAKPEDAFYVRIDETLNPFSEQALGRLYIEIGIRPTYPAEFIIVRIGIWPGGTETNEI